MNEYILKIFIVQTNPYYQYSYDWYEKLNTGVKAHTVVCVCFFTVHSNL